MNIFKKHKAAVLSLLAFVGCVVACDMITEIISLPEDAKVNTEVEIKARITLVPSSDDKTEFVFAMLTPKSWNTSGNAKVTFSTHGYNTQGGVDVVDEEMILIPDTEKEPSTQLSWPMAYQKKVGSMGNYGSVEWTLFKSKTMFIIDNNVSEETITADVTIRLTTGPENIKFFFGAGYAPYRRGLLTSAENNGDHRYEPNEVTKVFEVTGAEGGDELDFTVMPRVSSVPAAFRYGDIFAVRFNANDSDLEGEEKVILCGKAILAGGGEVVVGRRSGNVMEKLPQNSYQKYIYPRHFFSLPANAVIENIYCWFESEDGTKVVTAGDDGYRLKQADK